MKKLLSIGLITAMLFAMLAVVIPVSAADIASAGDFGSIANNGTYVLTADITITSGKSGTVSGITLDGNGHTITLGAGMTAGLFDKLTGSTVKNLTIKGTGELTFAGGTNGVGALAKDITDTTVENVTNEANIKVGSTVSWFGGLVGNVKGGSTLKSCVNKGKIIAGGGEYTGGIAGVNFGSGSFIGCKNYGNIESNQGGARNCAGGIVGYTYSGTAAIIGCINYGSVTGSGEEQYFGALVGLNQNASTISPLAGCMNFSSNPDFGGGVVAAPSESTYNAVKNDSKLSSLGADVYSVTADFTCAGGYTLPAGAVIIGNGHTITLSGNSALFASAGEGSVITDLNVEGSVSGSETGEGGIVASGDDVTMQNCQYILVSANVIGASVKLRDEASLLFYVGEAVFKGADDVSVTTSTGDKAVLLDGTAVIGGIPCKVYSVSGISPTRFTEKVKFSISVTKGGNTYTGEKEYSVKDYCMAQLASKDASSVLKGVCVDMLNYGAEAQKAAGVTSGLANADLTADQKNYGTSTAPTLSSSAVDYTGSANAAVAEWKKASVDFANEIAPVFTFTAASGVSGMTATVKYDGGETTVSSFTDLGSNTYSFKLNGLSAAIFDDIISVELKNASGASKTLNFSIMAYAKEQNTELATAALKYINSMYMYLSDVTTYDIKKYAAPIWDGTIVYAESAFVRENSKDDASVAPITLLYPIDKIISVRSSDMKTLYKEGVDYDVDDEGRLVIKTAAEGGSIKILPYYNGDDHTKEAYTYDTSGKYTADYMNKGGVYYYYNDPMYSGDSEGGIVKWNVSVTYTHEEEEFITVPTDYSDKFEGLMDKLVAGEKLTVVSLGDSITEGCSASANHGAGAWGPKAPAYNDMFCDYLEAAYGVDVTHKNYAIGGTTAYQALNNQGAYANNAPIPKVCADDPDIFILAYGMNDGGTNPDTEAGYIKSIIDKVKEQCPDVYVIVVSTCLLGQGYSESNGYRTQFGDKFEEVFEDEDNVVVANVTNVDIEIQGYDTKNETNHSGPKCYQDVTGSNSNHPNDFMHRIYLQTMIQAAFGENKFAK